MATNKNITMKEFNGTDYDILYPKTIASQIPDVYSKSETYPASQLYTQNQLYTKTQIDQFINNLQTQVNGRAKIQVGSYVGTGTYGQNNPCVLTFDEKPEWLFLYLKRMISNNTPSKIETDAFNIINFKNIPSVFTQWWGLAERYSDSTPFFGKYQNNQFSWYAKPYDSFSDSSYAQFNSKEYEYYYLVGWK